ncbi:MAG: hypothetical protein F9K09_01485 [Flavobacteriales bacterium]|nr:MAG: hypothetical protein F9K09_01485 [Flavobacteriales bacterium]
MKTKIKGVILIVLVTCSSYVFAQDVVTETGDTLRISSTGVISDLSNNTIGEVLSNGDIKDANGVRIGSIEGNNFKDLNNMVLGSINTTTGEVFDVNETKIGEVINGVTIKDISGNIIGIASSYINEKWLAAYYFFYFNN